MNRSPAPGRLSLRTEDAPATGDVVSAPYYGPETVLKLRRPYLADAVGLSTTASDYTSVDTSLVAPLFDDAFVEFLWLNDEGGYAWSDPRYARVVPYADKVNQGDSLMTELLARKWMRHAQRIGLRRAAEPNHQMVFLAVRHWSSGARGEARVSNNFNDLWLYTATMGNADLRAEALTHELGHEWLVNSTFVSGSTTITHNPGGHCDRAYGQPQHMGIVADAAHLCTMTSGDNMWTTGEARDRRVGFHYVTVPGQADDSEYLHIRLRAEPVPQDDNPRQREIP